jgi:hypothetical protein
MFKQENKKYGDYIDAGVTCKIIEHEVPCFVWNVDEKEILQYPNTYDIVEKDKELVFGIKPGNVMKNVKTYSELSQELMKEINSNYGIVFMPNHDSITNNNDRAYYRFTIVE